MKQLHAVSLASVPVSQYAPCRGALHRCPISSNARWRMDHGKRIRRGLIAVGLAGMLVALPLTSVGADPPASSEASENVALRRDLSAAMSRIDKLESDVKVLSIGIQAIADKVNTAPASSAPAPAVKPAPAQQEQAEQMVFVTRSGAKYHRAGCSYLKSGGSSMPLSQAKGKYSACSRCNPPS